MPSLGTLGRVSGGSLQVSQTGSLPLRVEGNTSTDCAGQGSLWSPAPRPHRSVALALHWAPMLGSSPTTLCVRRWGRRCQVFVVEKIWQP